VNFPEQIPLNDLSRWESAEEAEILSAIGDVVKSGVFINGPHVSAFEEKLGKLIGNRFVVGVGNGTDALVLSLLAIGIGKGDLVGTVANAGGYATNAILQIGAEPLLIDVDVQTAQMSCVDLKEKLSGSQKVKAVIVTHLYGLMANTKEIKEAVDSHGALLIEDCAQAIGAQLDGTPAGVFGCASTFSFYPTKNLGCLGDGGAIAFESRIHADYSRKLAQYGWSTRYVVDYQFGMNSRFDEIQAAVTNVRLKNLEAKNRVRQKIINKYQSSVGSSRRMIGSEARSNSGYLAVLVSPRRSEDQKKFTDAGIQTAVHFPVLDHRQSAWRNQFAGVNLPNSEFLVDQILTIPCFPNLTEIEIERVCETLARL